MIFFKYKYFDTSPCESWLSHFFLSVSRPILIPRGIKTRRDVQMESTNNEKIAEALALLEEAAKGKKDELKNLLSSKYASLKSTLVDATENAAETLSSAQRREVAALIQAKEVITEKVKETATVVDDHVHTNPWPYIGGSAVVGLLVGFILGQKK
jgi:ElaB/YqjD/DUF883 family membrane-anchored ribosome-binding protein